MSTAQGAPSHQLGLGRAGAHQSAAFTVRIGLLLRLSSSSLCRSSGHTPRPQGPRVWAPCQRPRASWSPSIAVCTRRPRPFSLMTQEQSSHLCGRSRIRARKGARVVPDVSRPRVSPGGFCGREATPGPARRVLAGGRGLCHPQARPTLELRLWAHSTHPAARAQRPEIVQTVYSSTFRTCTHIPGKPSVTLDHSCFPEQTMGLETVGSQHSDPLPSVRASLVAQVVKRLTAMWEARIQSLGWEDPLEKEMATHSSTLAWKIPRTEEPGRLQSMESQSQVQLSDFTFFLSLCIQCHRGRSHRAGQPPSSTGSRKG